MSYRASDTCNEKPVTINVATFNFQPQKTHKSNTEKHLQPQNAKRNRKIYFYFFHFFFAFLAILPTKESHCILCRCLKSRFSHSFLLEASAENSIVKDNHRVWQSQRIMTGLIDKQPVETYGRNNICKTVERDGFDDIAICSKRICFLYVRLFFGGGQHHDRNF